MRERERERERGRGRVGECERMASSPAGQTEGEQEEHLLLLESGATELTCARVRDLVK